MSQLQSTHKRDRALACTLAVLVACAIPTALLAGPGPTAALAAAGSVESSAQGSAAAASASSSESNELESAAHKAGETGRRVAMSLIALGFAFAAIVLAFRRDFKEAVGVFAVGVIAVLLAQETGVKLVENLVTALFGS